MRAKQNIAPQMTSQKRVFKGRGISNGFGEGTEKVADTVGILLKIPVLVPENAVSFLKSRRLEANLLRSAVAQICEYRRYETVPVHC